MIAPFLAPSTSVGLAASPPHHPRRRAIAAISGQIHVCTPLSLAAAWLSPARTAPRRYLHNRRPRRSGHSGFHKPRQPSHCFQCPVNGSICVFVSRRYAREHRSALGTHLWGGLCSSRLAFWYVAGATRQHSRRHAVLIFAVLPYIPNQNPYSSGLLLRSKLRERRVFRSRCAPRSTAALTRRPLSSVEGLP